MKNLRGDILGGVTAGIVALPLALAFGVTAFSVLTHYGYSLEEASSIGAKAGLYGAIGLSILAAIFGGTATQISGPTAPMTTVSVKVVAVALTGAAVASQADTLDRALPMILATFMVGGLMQISFGVLKLGKYIRFIPYSVVSGFMTGIGIIIIITSIFPFFGSANPIEEGFAPSLGVILNIHELPQQINWQAALLSVLSIAIIYLFPRITKVIPSPLVALILVSAFSYFVLHPDSVTVIGTIPQELPAIHFEMFAWFTVLEWETIIMYGLALSVLGLIDSLLTSVVADNITKTKHDSNRELIGQGIGNVAVAFLGGLPGAGATMRTVINVKSGGKTRLSGVISGLLLLVILLVAAPLVGHIPQPVLSGILITVGIGIIDYRGIGHIRKIPASDAIVMVVVLLLTVFWDLIMAVGFGMVIASIAFMKKMSEIAEENTEMAELSEHMDEIQWEDEVQISDEDAKKVYIKHLYGPLFFGFSTRLKEMVSQLPDIKIFIIRMERVPYMDQSGTYALEEIISDLKDKGITVVITGLQDQPSIIMERMHIIPDLVESKHVFKDITDLSGTIHEILKE